MIEQPEAIPEPEVIEIEEEADEAPEEENKEEESIADQLIRFAGLDAPAEEIEPAEEVKDEDLTAKLNEMFAGDEAEPETEEAEKAEEPEAPTEEEKPAEKPAPTSFNDMKSALDAIRARLKK